MLLTVMKGYSQEIHVIPKPTKSSRLNDQSFELSASSKIFYSTIEAKKEAEYLKSIIDPSTGFNLALTSNKQNLQSGDIVLRISPEDKTNQEAYSLHTQNGIIEIKSSSSAGVFYGIQTLLQLFPPEIYSQNQIENIEWTIAAVNIEDDPVFNWRGMHLDVARHFRTVDFVKKYIDLLAYHKMNTFHWHLTEDQGWRIEIKKYPKLTEIGAWRDSTLIGRKGVKPEKYKVERYGGFYSQKEIKEIVKYASDRHITIVPEIEMPGHAQAAVTAYPEYGCTGAATGVWTTWGVSEHIFSPEEKTIEFIKDILDEVMELFPGEYIHIGGDEAVKTQWENSERIQQLRKERGLKDMHEMQSWFISQIDKYLTEKGRKLIGWDEILEGGLAEGAAVMSWRGEAGGIQAAKMGHKVVMASNNYTYLDHYQSKNRDKEPLAIGGFLPLEKVYYFNPIPNELTREEAQYIIGAQAQLWSEYIPSAEHMEYMAFPRMCALSDVVWSNSLTRDYTDFLKTLRIHLKRLDYLDVNYRVPDEFRNAK